MTPIRPDQSDTSDQSNDPELANSANLPGTGGVPDLADFSGLLDVSEDLQPLVDLFVEHQRRSQRQSTRAAQPAVASESGGQSKLATTSSSGLDDAAATKESSATSKTSATWVTPRVGLTGGVAAGKSTLSKFLELHGATVIDHDELSREVVAPGTEGLEQIVERFGTDILHPDGSLNRPALGAIVFSDDGAREDLEAIVHPAVMEAGTAAESKARETGARLIVHDIPLLVETGQHEDFDVVVVVEAPLEVRLDRMMSRRGLSREQAESRIAAQASDEQRRAAADFVIDGGTSLRTTALEAAVLYSALTEK